MDLNGLGICSEDTLKACGVAIMACVLRVIVSKRFSPVSIIRRLIVCVLVGIYATEILKYLGVEGELRYAILGFVCFIADDIAAVALDVGKEFRRNPSSIFNFIKHLLDRK